MNCATGTVKAMVALYPGKCTECPGSISPGESILWSRASGARHAVCPSSLPPMPEVKRFISVEDKGVYALPGGAIVKVQATRDGQRTYALRWTEVGGVRVTQAGEYVNGEFVYESGLVGRVAETGRKLTLDEASAFLIRYGRCVRCGRSLKAAESVERGLGPVCVQYFA